jgi:predicted phosphoribosyltransferase
MAEDCLAEDCLVEDVPVFRDRRDAGRRLAAKLESYRGQDAIVMALPRGGVVVGYEIAAELQLPLDVVVARKLGAPMQPEYGIGAIAPGGAYVLDADAVRSLRITEEELDQVLVAEMREMERRERRYRDDRPPAPVSGRTVILVDDGLATGVTARAAIQCLRAQGPRRLVLAVPVCAAETAEAMARHDAVVRRK